MGKNSQWNTPRQPSQKSVSCYSCKGGNNSLLMYMYLEYNVIKSQLGVPILLSIMYVFLLKRHSALLSVYWTGRIINIQPQRAPKVLKLNVLLSVCSSLISLTFGLTPSGKGDLTWCEGNIVFSITNAIALYLHSTVINLFHKWNCIISGQLLR